MQPFCETLLNKNGKMQSFPSKVWQPDLEIGLVAENEKNGSTNCKNLNKTLLMVFLYGIVMVYQTLSWDCTVRLIGSFWNFTNLYL